MDAVAWFTCATYTLYDYVDASLIIDLIRMYERKEDRDWQ
jgi:hypothetical protein